MKRDADRNFHKIEVNHDMWSYELEPVHCTSVYDPEGDLVVQLQWSASAKEVEAAVLGFIDGVRCGRKAGEDNKLREIQQALGIPHGRATE